MSSLDPKRSVTLGKYRELAIPETWLEVLEPLMPFAADLTLSPARDIRNELTRAFGVLDERVRRMVCLRYGFEDGNPWTLAALGETFALTRERVRQVIDKALKHHDLVSDVRSIVDDYWADVEGRGLAFFSMPEAGLGNCYIGVANLLGLEIVSLPNGTWVLFGSQLRHNKLHQHLHRQPQFLTLQEAAQISGLDEYELIHCHPLFEGAFLTVGGKLGSRKWSMPEFIEAVAWELTGAGIQEWHFSQMAQAMKILLPGEYSHLTPRLIAAVVARPDSRFQNVGARGVWRLAHLGDGFADTKEAVIAVLKSCNLPLHHGEILQRLGRPIRSQTLLALVSREPEFYNFGGGFYGLLGESYSLAEETPEEVWLLGLLGNGNWVSVEEAEQAAVRAGLSFSRVRAIAQVSKKLHYNYKANTFERVENWLQRRFERWYANRANTELPSDEILAHGIRNAIAGGKQQQLKEIAELLGYEVHTLVRLVGLEPENRS